MTEAQVAELAAFPHKFQLKQNWMSLHHRIAVENMDGHEVGSYHQELLSFSDKYHLNDKDGHTLAVAKKAHLSWGVEYGIKNKVNKDRYTIKEKKISSAVHIGEMYSIEKNGHEIVECQKTDLLYKKITVTQKDDTRCATLTKAWMGLHDTWKVSVKDAANIPPWVVGFFAAILQIQHTLEAKKEKEEKEKEEKEKHDKEKEEKEKLAAAPK